MNCPDCKSDNVDLHCEELIEEADILFLEYFCYDCREFIQIEDKLIDSESND